MKISSIKRLLPAWPSAALAVLSAILLILAFPGFEWWTAAWFALVPLLFAVEREKESAARSFVTGWIFGTCFFFGTCWWLTFPPINYAGFPPALAYFLLVCVCLTVGLFPALFALILSMLLKRLGTYAVLFAPFVWIATEFLRFWIAGNNWNAIGYSQAFGSPFLFLAEIGGVLMVGFIIVAINSTILFSLINDVSSTSKLKTALFALPFVFIVVPLWIGPGAYWNREVPRTNLLGGQTNIVAIQPNVPMSGLSSAQYEELKRKHIISAEGAFTANLDKMATARLDSYSTEQKFATGLQVTKDVLTEKFQKNPKIVIFPESPMNFMYEDDKDFQEWVRAFAVKNNASVLFNSAEPDPANKKYFNSAVMVDQTGKKVAQYDKIYLLPFGETVPAPLQSIVPALVGSFSYGKEYDLLPLGEAKGGVMICFESHFPNLSREYVNEGADVLIEMTNDGYLGPTPVLRQHLANAVFRAVETDRPLVRVTNVGISAYIDERGQVLEPTEGYTEDTRVWSVSKSNGSKTFYVRYGDWFAWVSVLIALGLLIFAGGRRRKSRA